MKDHQTDFQPVHRQFFSQPTLSLAKALLGTVLVKVDPEGITAGYIVETEAYMGPDDQATHSYQNRRTKRTEIMYHQYGFAYIYRMHTHCLFNVVSGGEDSPEAVLVRALEPFEGLAIMQTRRGSQKGVDLTNGPGKLTKALNITMADYGHLLTKSPLFIATGYHPTRVSIGKRIGIENSGEAVDYPWRFWITDNPYVSRHQKTESIEEQERP